MIVNGWEFADRWYKCEAGICGGEGRTSHVLCKALESTENPWGEYSKIRLCANNVVEFTYQMVNKEIVDTLFAVVDSEIIRLPSVFEATKVMFYCKDLVLASKRNSLEHCGVIISRISVDFVEENLNEINGFTPLM